MNRKGGLLDLPVNLLMLFISITFLVALIPGLTSIINTAQQSDGLNCAGYTATSPVYNSSIPTSSIACMAIKLYVPYIVLGVLIAGVAILFYGRPSVGGGSQDMYG